MICSAVDGSLRAPVQREDLVGLLEPRHLHTYPPAEREQYRRLVEAGRGGARLHWGFDSLGDAMTLLLASATRAPRFGLMHDEPLALGVVEGRISWRDTSLVRPSAGSMATEVPHLLPPAQRERLRWSIFTGAVLVLQPEGERIEDPITAAVVWDRVTRALVRGATDRRTKRRTAKWPRTAAGWAELWAWSSDPGVLDVMLRIDRELRG